jgi:hypothetical protein
MSPKTKSERLQIVNEIKMNCIENRLGNQVALKVLYMMLHNYYQEGTTYINKKLTLQNNEQMIVVNLYNDKGKIDKVIITRVSE